MVVLCYGSVKCIVSSPVTKGEVLSSLGIIIVGKGLHFKIFFSEATEPDGIKIGRNVNWMVLQKVEDMRMMAKVTNAENFKSLILSQIFMLFFFIEFL